MGNTFALPNTDNKVNKSPTVSNTTGYDIPPKTYQGVPQKQDTVPSTPGVQATYKLGGVALGGNDTTNVVLPGTTANPGTST